MPSSDPRVVVLCPRRPGMPERDRLWGFVRAWWARDFPQWPIFEGDDGGKLGEPFNRSRGLNVAADLAGDWDVAVTIDGDVLLAAEPVRQAVQIAAATGRPVLAYHERVGLTAQATEKILAGFMGNWRTKGFERNVFYESCSSAYVVRRDLWDAVGGFDELFVGWGWEDVAFRCATETMARCELIKVAATLFHLWHTVSSGNNKAEPTFQANGKRAERYRAARFDIDAMSTLLDEAGRARTTIPAAPVSETRIPRILHRSVPAETTAEVEGWWQQAGEMNPSWELRTHRDPLDPADWPMTSDLWDRCTSGAQLAGLIRLEALYVSGGLYYDSDLKPLQPIPDALLSLPAVAAWEDRRTVPDAVLGCEPRHPAFAEMIGLARDAVEKGKGAWDSGPGVTTAVLPGRSDVLLLPPGSWYPWHWKEKATIDQYDPEPWAWGIHMWHFSWQPPT